jgi:hypothetical protein
MGQASYSSSQQYMSLFIGRIHCMEMLNTILLFEHGLVGLRMLRVLRTALHKSFLDQTSGRIAF